ncbi:hypothetical protein BKA64DRAFT_637479 [Cadophora sp. MPI-SDFR-AT-0126]|nr:hypothetical protein BKA64DRAFT_637479 [Leotiomycetes sp. MPI-SDFR-AT-0126]
MYIIEDVIRWGKRLLLCRLEVDSTASTWGGRSYKYHGILECLDQGRVDRRPAVHAGVMVGVCQRVSKRQDRRAQKQVELRRLNTTVTTYFELLYEALKSKAATEKGNGSSGSAKLSKMVFSASATAEWWEVQPNSPRRTRKHSMPNRGRFENATYRGLKDSAESGPRFKTPPVLWKHCDLTTSLGDATKSITTVHRKGRETDDGTYSIVPGSSAALGCQGHNILCQETDESGDLSPFGRCFGSSLCFSMIKSLRVAKTDISPMLSLSRCRVGQ